MIFLTFLYRIFLGLVVLTILIATMSSVANRNTEIILCAIGSLYCTTRALSWHDSRGQLGFWLALGERLEKLEAWIEQRGINQEHLDNVTENTARLLIVSWVEIVFIFLYQIFFLAWLFKLLALNGHF